MKKLCAVLLCAAMLAGCGSAGAQASAAASQEASASAAAATVADGTYTGTAAGNNGPISVSVTIKDGKITDVQVTDNVETQGIGDVAVEQIPQAMVTNNT
ncbi:FMN-binding protein, partial [Galactobacillus timonensis]|uniref:FMN-binding protein n=1 Tax=Galactobacillus timonensis TaxID=2041840 RepID=UPI0023F258B7